MWSLIMGFSQRFTHWYLPGNISEAVKSHRNSRFHLEWTSCKTIFHSAPKGTPSSTHIHTHTHTHTKSKKYMDKKPFPSLTAYSISREINVSRDPPSHWTGWTESWRETEKRSTEVWPLASCPSGGHADGQHGQGNESEGGDGEMDGRLISHFLLDIQGSRVPGQEGDFQQRETPHHTIVLCGSNM